MKKISHIVDRLAIVISVRRKTGRKRASSNGTMSSIVFNLAIVSIAAVLCAILWILLSSP